MDIFYTSHIKTLNSKDVDTETYQDKEAMQIMKLGLIDSGSFSLAELSFFQLIQPTTHPPTPTGKVYFALSLHKF